jgi:hypothetical protein
MTVGYGYSWREGSYDHNCQKVVSFTPEAGKAYEFVGTTVTQARMCGVRVVRLDAPTEPLPHQEAPRCKG